MTETRKEENKAAQVWWANLTFKDQFHLEFFKFPLDIFIFLWFSGGNKGMR